MFLMFGRTLGKNELHLLLLSLAVIGLELIGHGHIVLRPPELVVQLGMVEGQGNERSKLGDQLLVILGLGNIDMVLSGLTMIKPE